MVTGLVLAACHRASVPAAIACCGKSPAKAEDAGADTFDTAAAVDAGSAAAGLPAGPKFRRADGCARDYKPSGSTDRDMSELQRLCAQGMAPLSDAVTVAVAVDGAAEATFRVTSPGVCLRAGAVALSGALSLSLIGPSGEA